jgi:alcohol dehydrogenase
VTSLCPGGKERMRRLMSAVASGRVDLKPLVTHRFKLDEIEAAYDLSGHQRDGVLGDHPLTRNRPTVFVEPA